MNSVRITYIVCDMIFSLALLVFAAVSPIWITPGYYWWTTFAILGLLSQGTAFTKRLNSWEGMGKA